MNQAAHDEVMWAAHAAAGIVRRILPSRAYRVVLFGSWASGKAGERSDIDVGIEGPMPVDPAAMDAIRDAVDALPTIYSIDIVDLGRVDREFRASLTARVVDLEAAK